MIKNFITPSTEETINFLSERLMKIIKDVADLTIPKRKKVKATKEIWKDDEAREITERLTVIQISNKNHQKTC